VYVKKGISVNIVKKNIAKKIAIIMDNVCKINGSANVIKDSFQLIV